MHSGSTSPVVLDEYFARIGFDGTAVPDLATLRALHLAHASRIPFENLDVLLGHPIRIDLTSVFAKLVKDRRGGYCFEQNALFAEVLERIGFSVTRLAARVRLGTTRVLPRTHMLLVVSLENQSWLCDVGFGGWGLLDPVPLIPGEDLQQGAWTFRLENRGNDWLLQCLQCPLGPDQYVFDLTPHLPVDYEPANHYCATYPESRFVQTLTAQLPSLTERVMLRNRELLTITPQGTHTEILPDQDALLYVLRERFGLFLSAETKFRIKIFED